MESGHHPPNPLDVLAQQIDATDVNSR